MGKGARLRARPGPKQRLRAEIAELEERDRDLGVKREKVQGKIKTKKEELEKL